MLHAHLVANLGDFALEVELRASPGVTVLFGPSGAGKTSVLRALSGLIPLRAGFVRFGADEWTSLPPERRAIGYVFQSFLLIATLTAWALCRWAFEVPFVFSPVAAAETVLLALVFVLTIGAIATWRVLSAKAAPYLRAE